MAVAAKNYDSYMQDGELGVSILAAYSEVVSPTGLDFDKRRLQWALLSGTSMSCPHISGIARLLKSAHPNWSPAAIRSAIMTSARTRDNTRHSMRDETYKRTDPLAYGAGHIRPNRATDPALVYDLTINDHLNFLCAIGYNQTSIQPFADKTYKCTKSSSVHNFNYPSIAVGSLEAKITVTRRLKNVGNPGTYYARLRQPESVLVSVKINILTFKKIGEEKSFELTLIKNGMANQTSYAFGELLWQDGHHFVRSPIVVGP
ncbi:hypothetical protein M9H77_19982 [Catharanthus roseus]|uniref:Uncharacterized protein n=1 Tax=Catharanthus roseus TaxID=4058 RepID=A0ACC0AKG6_CATRO|nr:hypothetical protein M9H77_19982 [Catharanthus roseus]